MSAQKAALRRVLVVTGALTAIIAVAACGSSPALTSSTAPSTSAIAVQPVVQPVVQAATETPASSPSPEGIGQLDYPADGPLADITTGPASMTWTGDASLGDQYFLVHAVLHVAAPGEVTIDAAQVVVLGPDGSEVGAVQVVPAMLNQGGDGYASQPMTVVSGTVPVTFVADQEALSGSMEHTAEITSVTYDDGATAP